MPGAYINAGHSAFSQARTTDFVEDRWWNPPLWHSMAFLFNVRSLPYKSDIHNPVGPALLHPIAILWHFGQAMYS